MRSDPPPANLVGGGAESLVDKSAAGRRPVDEFLRFEPKGDLFLGGFFGVGTVDDVAAEIETEITADGSRERGLGVSFSHHHSAGLGGILALPNHWHHGTRRHELAKAIVKRFTLEIDVVLLQVLFRTLHELHGDEFESSLLESFDDITNESALNAIGLHHDKSALVVSCHL